MHHVGFCLVESVLMQSFGELPEKLTAKSRWATSLLNIFVSVKGCCSHETVTLLTLLAGMTEAESARLDFFHHLTGELGRSVFGNGNIAPMQLSVSVSKST